MTVHFGRLREGQGREVECLTFKAGDRATGDMHEVDCPRCKELHQMHKCMFIPGYVPSDEDRMLMLSPNLTLLR